MIAFREISLTVYKTEYRKVEQSMVVWNAREPLVGDLDDRKYTSEVGLKNLSFFMTLEEFNGILDGRLSAASDIGHYLRTSGADFMFYDLEFPRETRGVFTVPFVRLDVPYYVRRILKRVVRIALRRAEVDGDRISVPIPFTLRERWVKQYGIGKGQVEIQASDETLALVERHKSDPDFAWSYESVRAIAQNTTDRHTDRAKLTLSAFGDREVGWAAYTPKGAFRMNGGIIDHGKDGKHDWHVHT